ncbi:MAG: haloacid dehalogenase-like hydrolase [Gemmatimonadetes bacterium]|nr:haloacid dehalogenase-like hydrolase [Gemmatimonadota bacterium]MBI3567734.1 haloacid dehalogenase-like hydrolase [Gemmatimonadota bacterium]
MKVALFDIDGTILWSHGAGRRSMERALKAIFGTTGPGDYRYDGKTDKQIVRETMRAAGFTDADVDARMDAVIDAYVSELSLELAETGHHSTLLPGVAEILDAVDAHEDIVLGLLTGNVVHGAEQKLRSVGVDFARFQVGAFGSDHEVRHELPGIARERARALVGRDVPGDACVVIGDTPNDVACARPIGARTIAVATGSYGVDHLAACGPDAVFPDLSNTAAVLAAILDA